MLLPLQGFWSYHARLSAAEIRTITPLSLSGRAAIPVLTNHNSLLVSFGGGFSCWLFLLVVLLFLGLDEVPFLLTLDGNSEGSVVVASAVVANAHVPPKLVSQKGDTNHVRVVQLVVVADPGADQSPGGLDCGVTAEEGSLLWPAS